MLIVQWKLMLPISIIEISWLRTLLVIIVSSNEIDYFSLPLAVLIKSGTPVYLGPEVTAYNAIMFNVMSLTIRLVNVKSNTLLISWSL
jgi:hypothetical protein